MRILTYACLILFGCAGPPADSENEAAAPITSEVVPQEASAPVLWVRVVEETSFLDDQVSGGSRPALIRCSRARSQRDGHVRGGTGRMQVHKLCTYLGRR